MTAKKPKKQKAACLCPFELINQLLAQVENENAKSILGESGLAGMLKKMLAGAVPDVHLAPDPQLDGARVMERPEKACSGLETDLADSQRRGGRRGA